MTRILVGIGLLVVGWVVGAVVLDQRGLRPAPSDRWDLIVVAGCRVRPDGTPSLALARRTAAAVALWERGIAPAVVFTGGVGDHGGSEASVAAAHAVSLGLPRSAAHLEERSTSTEENARFAAELFPARRVIVVTDSYHVFRAERVFGRHYPEVRGVGSPPRLPYRVKGALREVFALGWYAASGRL